MQSLSQLSLLSYSQHSNQGTLVREDYTRQSVLQKIDSSRLSRGKRS